MRKIISIILTFTILCVIGITAFAADVDTVGGKITLTQFIGADAESTKQIKISVASHSSDIIIEDINKFYDICDNITLTSSLDPDATELSGTYITVEKKDGATENVFISETGGVDKYSKLMSRMPYALYTVDNLSLVDSLLSPAQSNSNTVFSDVAGHWAENTINKWKENGIISGYPDGTFQPDNPVTRAELAKIVTLAFDLQENEFVYNENDIDISAWYYQYLQCAAKYIPVYALPVGYDNNIPYVDNSDENSFLPECYAIRMHVAETLVEIKKEKEKLNIEIPSILEVKSSINDTFKDSDYENLYAMHGTIPKNVQRMFEYTWLAKELDIMQGDTNGYFRPYDNVTRAELLTMIDRILEK